MPNPVRVSPTFYGVKGPDGNYGTEVVCGNSYKPNFPVLFYPIIMSLSLQSTYKLVSGYEIPVVGFGVSALPQSSPVPD